MIATSQQLDCSTVMATFAIFFGAVIIAIMISSEIAKIGDKKNKRRKDRK